ncbi:MAG TPA: hypothetical protein VL285_13190 [Bryobacteraceae bacterium]|nr:hypothetical protein [Bryobacteraceae bacterium]
MLDRRAFLLSSAAGVLRAAGEPKRIAAVVTEYRPNSHADVIVGKYLDGFRQDGRPPKPRSRVVSLFTAQVPANDLSRERARQHNVPIFPTIADALTMGKGRLAVDGVLLIGEHGDYPTNEKGQKLYPRYQFFTEITDVFRKTGRSVPVFNDKHLSYSWIKAKRMVEISRELNFPFMAGSSVPVAFRKPQVDTPLGAEVCHAVAIAYSGIEIYGFHTLEALQCMVERRGRGETGVAAVQCLEKEAVWNYLDKTPWARKLFDHALARSGTRTPGSPRESVREPAVFLVDYRDGLKAAAFLMTGAVKDFTVALDIGRAEPLSVLMWLEEGKPYGHFGCLVRNIEKMFETGQPTYPVERTLLTSGILDFAMESRFRAYKRLATRELDVRYRMTNESHYCHDPSGTA